MPPLRTGIADYSSALLPHLKVRYDVRVVADQAGAQTPSSDLRTFDPAAYLFDEALPIYQMGNNVDFHSFVYQAACMRPGILELHDVCLGRFHFEYYARRGQLRLFLDELEYSEGEVAATTFWRALRKGASTEALVELPMARRLVETSRAVIVHNNASRDLLLDRYRQKNIHRFHLGSAVDPTGIVRPNRARTLRVGAFGIVYETKRIDVLLLASAAVIEQLPDLEVEIVGPFGSPRLYDQLTQLAAELNLQSHVRFVGETSAADFDRRLKDCDVIVNLRYPSHGEASAVMMRAFGAGKPVIASDIPAFSDFSPEYCWRIPVGPGEREALGEALLCLAHQPELRTAMGESAQRMVRTEATWEAVAHQHAMVIDDVITRSMPPS